MSKIRYWLVRRPNVIRECQYAQFGPDGEIQTTEYAKRAIRFMTEEGAAQLAARLGWPWIIVAVDFEGSEPAI